MAITRALARFRIRRVAYVGIPRAVLDARPRGIAAHVRARLDVPLLLDADQHAIWSDHQPAPRVAAF